ncbi:hypothetical protein P872_22795 [Rhodonellum psychrophilum GCM71 = DSM 17998]|uniref:Uncharacterized protein n=1 Tax=Rhodonellum psychrophilum GCM71 = DSM 17998 TaxID=1123057 RepID=U5C9P2_9BACT|nr:hypothetical protein P872_22795 [Rhodonellum psychrophilum GCM71 = DSM 17998]
MGAIVASFTFIAPPSFAQESLPGAGFKQIVKICKDSGKMVEICEWVDYESYCDPSIQEPY